jgi:N-methylhydantoinase B
VPLINEATKALRDLTNEEFTAEYGCDRFTASVLASRFRYIIDHVSNSFISHAFSPVIRESTDMSATIAGPPETGFAMAAVSQTTPLFYGSMPEAVRIALEECGIEQLVRGDLILVNDPYRVGTHLNDMCFIRPTFQGNRLIGGVTIRAHMLDIGGPVPGGFEVTKQELYGDGLVLPPILLYHAGEPVRSTFNLLLDNTRQGAVILPDIQTISKSLELGEQLLEETVQKYGFDAYVGAVRYACDTSAEAMRVALARLPDGVYEGEDRLDSDGVRTDIQPIVRVRITKRGGRAEFDLGGSSPSSSSAVNCGWPDAKTAVAIALKHILDPHTPFTSGSLRDVDIVLPVDSLINSSPPHTCQFYFTPVTAILNATMQALNEAVGDAAIAFASSGMLHYAYGETPEGAPWFSAALYSVTPNGPWGATRAGDSDANQLTPLVNVIDSGCEPAEAETPVVVMRRDHLPDTAGPGLNRSGPASIADTLWLLPGQHRITGSQREPAPGVNGGGSGTLAAGWLWDPGTDPFIPSFLPLELEPELYAESTPLVGMLDPTTKQPDPHGTNHLLQEAIPASAGTVLRLVCSGGGGWGDPFEREPQRVLLDVRDEYVSIAGAERDYGVVVRGDPVNDPEGLRIDEGATMAIRALRKATGKGA